MKKNCYFLFVCAFFALPTLAIACSDCEDKVCVGPVCGCVVNIGRCPARIEPGNSHSYCIIGSKPTDAQGRSSCTNCKSQLSGDAGKSDCLIRLQGDHVNDGDCAAQACYEVL
jgi:hypothetical protein